ncbi:MAG: biotin--[acetyl-CoA-carboxylase] ligase [Bacteroidales bacterium]|jgi:BirA family biotin operon repressor/biotin-[acetyl-CoA-carboxylase] ligase
MIIGSNLIYFTGLTSSNTCALSLAREKKVAEGTVVYTDFQTEGKGQSGSSWESEKGKNLLISVILFPLSVRPEDQFIISMAISVGICDFIDIYLPGSKIKWPNDIYVNDKKIAGILIENSIMGASFETAVAGIGLNINQENYPPDIPNPVSLKMITGKEYDRGRCMQQLLECLDSRYSQVLYGNRNKLWNEYVSRLFRINEWHLYSSGKRTFRGMLTGISSYGKALIMEMNGPCRQYDFREVDFIR